MRSKAQVGIEYMIILGFVTLAVMFVLVLATIYSDQIKDKIKINQVESFSIQLINSAESVFFSGEPSKTTVSLYLPEGITEILISSDALIITLRTSSGENKRAYDSRVPINGSISLGEGIKKLSLEAKETFVQIN